VRVAPEAPVASQEVGVDERLTCVGSVEDGPWGAAVFNPETAPSEDPAVPAGAVVAPTARVSPGAPATVTPWVSSPDGAATIAARTPTASN
jgi:hypothetical protein